MPVPITRYRPSRQYLWAGFSAVALAGFSSWVAVGWIYAWIAVALFVVSAVFAFFLALRPPIDIYENHLKVGKRAIPWMQVRRVDRSSRIPLVVRLSLADKTHVLIVYSGTPESGNGLLRHLRRYSKEALIDGVPYRQFWGEAISAAQAQQERKQLPPPRYPLLLPTDEAEVERLFQRLKSVGHLDQRSSSEDK